MKKTKKRSPTIVVAETNPLLLLVKVLVFSGAGNQLLLPPKATITLKGKNFRR